MAADVTVVVPTHDRSALLALTLRSVLWQRDVDLEVVVVDDGSTDDTAAVVAGFRDPRVRRVRHDVPRGVSAARNRGIAEASGRWVAFVDDDDLWAPDKLARQLRAAHDTGRAWAYTGAVRIDINQRVISGAPPPDPDEIVARVARWNPVPGGCSSVLVSTELVRAVGRFDGQLVNLADWDLWIRLAREAGRPAGEPSPLVGYRHHGSNRSLETALILNEARMIQQRYGTPLDWGGIFRYLAWLCVRSGRRREGLWRFWQAAMRGEARVVVKDLSGLLRSRFPALLGHPGRDMHAEWKALAVAWLGNVTQ